MEWQLNSDRPVYLQLVEQLQLAVVSGMLAPGSRVPSVRELAAEAAVNPNTMQRALTELEGEGLVVTQRTSGRCVTVDTGHIAAAREKLADGQLESFLAQMKKLGYTPVETKRLVTERLEEETDGTNS